MIIKGEVTKEDIKHGFVRSSSNCPIARSLGRILPDDVRVSVGKRTITIDRKVEYLISKFRIFIRRFDDDLPVKPFKYVFPTNHDYELRIKK
jgi:hypothetical protein